MKAIYRGLFLIYRRGSINSNMLFILGAAGFEDVISDYVDAITIVKKIKNVRKRAIIIYKVMGYDNWDIAIFLGVSKRTIDNLIKSIKLFLRKVGG